MKRQEVESSFRANSVTCEPAFCHEGREPELHAPGPVSHVVVVSPAHTHPPASPLIFRGEITRIFTKNHRMNRLLTAVDVSPLVHARQLW